MTYKYTFKKYEPEKMSRAVGTDLSISTKNAIEVCNAIRGKKVEKAVNILVEAIELKKAIPFKRFTDGVGHKPKIGPGRFIPKTCKNILNILNSAISNAEEKTLDKEKLIILHINANRASKPLHQGRRRREMKRTHIEIVLGEIENNSSSKSKKQQKTREVKKKETKNKETINKKDTIKEKDTEKQTKTKETNKKEIENKTQKQE